MKFEPMDSTSSPRIFLRVLWQFFDL